MMEVFKTFTFEAAHYLPYVPPGHQCGKMHGHSYKMVIGLRGTANPSTGFVIDFADLKSIVGPIVELLDHSTLNDFMPNPTCELLVDRVFHLVQPKFPPGTVSLVEIWETATAGARLVIPG